MKDREVIADALEQITAELQQLHMAQTVQRSAYLLLVRHLSAQGHVQLSTLLADLEAMGQTQTDASWRSAHKEVASALRLLQSLPSARQK